MKTHIGNVRSNNEDAVFVHGPVLAVADGMGGHAAGEVASAAVVKALQRRIPTNAPISEEPATFLMNAVASAYRYMVETVDADVSLRDMGTTLTAVFVEGERLHIAHVGDSRAYLLSDRGLQQLTTDHSIAAELVRAGQLDEKEANRHPHRHVLTRAVSAHKAPEVDIIRTEWFVGDTLLLCTDGLTAHVGDETIAGVLRGNGNTQSIADELVHRALEGGGSDNVTVVVARREQLEVIR